jgi:hypothetical protein
MDTKHDDDSSSCDDHTELISLTSSSDASASEAARSSFPPNTSTNFPSYFMCPITNTVMTDPVMDSEGNTFERDSILRWLVLYDSSPLTGKPVDVKELSTDRVVKGAIEKARKDAWVRYILDFEKDASTTASASQASGRRAKDDSFENFNSDSTHHSSPGSHGSKKIYVKRNSEQVGTGDHSTKSNPSPRSPGKTTYKVDKGIDRMPSLPIQVEAKKKKGTPSPPPQAKSQSARNVHAPPPPPRATNALTLTNPARRKILP